MQPAHDTLRKYHIRPTPSEDNKHPAGHMQKTPDFLPETGQNTNYKNNYFYNHLNYNNYIYYLSFFFRLCIS